MGRLRHAGLRLSHRAVFALGRRRRRRVASDDGWTIHRHDIGSDGAGSRDQAAPARTPDVADVYEALLEDIPNLAILNLDLRAARIGAELRATHGLRTPDALQIGACLAHGAEAFVTNDQRWRRVKGINVVWLNEFV